MGSPPALSPLAGRPLLSYPLLALTGALDQVVIATAPGEAAPEVDVPVWVAPQPVGHPLLAVADALRRAAPRAVVTVPANLPFVSSLTVAQLAAAPTAAVVAARAGAEAQPLLARFSAEALAVLAAVEEGAEVLEVVLGLDPAWVETDPAELLAVENADALATAERRLRPA